MVVNQWDNYGNISMLLILFRELLMTDFVRLIF